MTEEEQLPRTNSLTHQFELWRNLEGKELNLDFSMEADRTQPQGICGGSKLERLPGVLGRGFTPTGNQRAMKCRAISDWSYETNSKVRPGSRSFHLKRYNGERRE